MCFSTEPVDGTTTPEIGRRRQTSAQGATSGVAFPKGVQGGPTKAPSPKRPPHKTTPGEDFVLPRG